MILGRNAVDEALSSGVPGVELAIGDFLTDDMRTTRAKANAQSRGIPVVVRNKRELDGLADGLPHQGIALLVAPFAYGDLHDVLHGATDERAPLVVVLDHLQDGRNLGAIARTAAAFGVTGLVIPNRRAAGVTAAAWRASAGALARMPVARVVNLARTVASLQKAGYLVVGLTATGGRPLRDVVGGHRGEAVALVVGGEADGLSRLVADQCDALATIPITDHTESLNASVAAAIAMHVVREA